MSRINWIQYAILLAEVTAIRSEDPYVKTGACVLKKDGSVGALGYNGAPSKIEIDWSDRDKRRDYVIHAEANALRLLKPGDDLWFMALTMPPCLNCLKTIASYGIKRIYYNRPYSSEIYGSVEKTKEIAQKLGIHVERIEFNFLLYGFFGDFKILRRHIGFLD